jgi:hypothetical protein
VGFSLWWMMTFCPNEEKTGFKGEFSLSLLLNVFKNYSFKGDSWVVVGFCVFL